MRRLVALLLFVTLAVAVVAAVPSGADQTAPSSTTATATTPVPPAPVCHVTERYHHWFARKVYHRKRISTHARQRLRHIRGCASSPAAHKRERGFESRQLHWRHVRQRRAREKRLRECGSAACNRRLGIYMAERVYGRGAGGCIDYIVSHEGGWGGVHQYNLGGSGAYGLPQALPASKMASAGRDWADSARTQIRWMLGYVREYGGICGAAAHWRAARSY